jgi:putative FmdB family regulatory protein
MPFYDYECDDCGTITEDVMHAWDATPNVECPQCGEGMRKLMPTPRLQTDTRFMGGRDAQFERGHGVFSEQLNQTIYSRGHARKVLEEKGWGSETLGVKPRFPEPKEKYEVAPDIVEKEIKRKEQTERGGVPFTPKQKAEQRQALKTKLSGKQ